MNNILLTTSLLHYFHIWYINGFSFSTVDLTLFMMTNRIFNTLKTNFKKFIEYHTLKKLLDERYPNLQEEDLNKEKRCPICLDQMDTCSGKKLDCTHGFHLNCIKKWVQTSITCPVCRKSIFEKDSKEYNAWVMPVSFEIVQNENGNQ